MTRIIHLNLKKLISHVHGEDNAIAYPTRSIKFLAAIGMIVPPSDTPVKERLIANDLRFLNHCATIAGSGQKIIPQDNPVKRT